MCGVSVPFIPFCFEQLLNYNEILFESCINTPKTDYSNGPRIAATTLMWTFMVSYPVRLI